MKMTLEQIESWNEINKPWAIINIKKKRIISKKFYYFIWLLALIGLLFILASSLTLVEGVSGINTNIFGRLPSLITIEHKVSPETLDLIAQKVNETIKGFMG